MRCTGFVPYVNEDSEILILGSFPSVMSRKSDFYYGNPQNRFWKVLSAVYNAPLPCDNDSKKALLKANKIALWDMVTECDIDGSMDSAIKNATVADIDSFLSRYKIKRIIANGKTAYRYLSLFPQYLPFSLCLPSTSPANPRFSFDAWKKALLFL